MTPQRRLIVEYIHDNQSHLTADELLNFLETRVASLRSIKEHLAFGRLK